MKFNTEKLIKRYVIEYANDCYKSLEKADETIRTNKWSNISRIVIFCEYGYISNFEAVKKITAIMETED
jgi:hypothetical protein